MRHQGQIVLKGNGGDLKLVRSDRLTLPFKRTADFSALRCARVIERERRERRKKHVQFCMFTTWIGARFGAMPQFVHDNGTEHDVGNFRRLPTCDQTRLLLPEQDADVVLVISEPRRRQVEVVVQRHQR